MNFFQKRVLSLGAFIANISLTMVVAGVATFAWFQAQAATITTQDATTTITAKSGATVEYEFLNFNEKDKKGHTSSNAADFTLATDDKAYDKYIASKNTYANSIIRATVDGSWTKDNDLFIDIKCVSGHAPSRDNKRTVDYTSNVAQFKVFTYSYVKDGVEYQIDNSLGIPAVTPSTMSATADTRYKKVTQYFAETGLPGERFVNLHANSLSKPSDTITLIAPSLGLLDEEKATSITVYIECSYNKKLAAFYNGPVSLTADITDISFYTGAHYGDAYMKVDENTTITKGTASADDKTNKYLITYDGYTSDDMNPAFNGSLTPGGNLAAGNNYDDVYVRADRIAHTEITDAMDFSYLTDNKLRSHSGLNVGLTGEASYVSGTGYINAASNGPYTNTIAYSTDHTNVRSDQETDRYLQFNPAETNFKYYDSTQQNVQMYKLDTGMKAYETLSSLTLNPNSGTSPLGDPWSYSGTVSAVYSDGHSEDVTDKVLHNIPDVYTLGPQTVTFSYRDPLFGNTVTAEYSLTINNPAVSLTVDDTNAKHFYELNEEFSKEGLIVTATFKDGTYRVLEASEYTCNGYDKTVTGTQNIDVSFEGVTVDNAFTVTVVTQGGGGSGDYVRVSSLTAGDQVIIVTTKNAVNYYLPSTTTSSAPTASTITVDTGGTTISGSHDDKLFTVSGSSNAWVFTNSSGKTLYTNDDNNGIRIGNTEDTYTITSTDSSNDCFSMMGNTYSRYTGIYSTQDWRSYTTSNASNYSGSGEAIQFFKKNSSSATLDSITINNPNQTTYYTGQAFVKPTVWAIYSNGTYSVLGENDFAISPSNPVNGDFDGPQITRSVTVTYEGKTTSYNITVINRVPTSLTLTNPKTDFIEGQDFTFGGTATVTYNGGTPASESVTPVCTGYDPDVTGQQTITASYTSNGVTVYAEPYVINVTQKELTGITLNTTNVQKAFTQGDVFNYTNLGVTANYNNGKSYPVTSGYTVSSPNMGTLDTQAVTVSYTDNGATMTASYNITINAATLVISGTGVSNHSVHLVVGNSLNLTATLTPSGSTINWSTANSSYVSISAATGTSIQITAVAKTNSTIRISAVATVNGYTPNDYVDVTIDSPTVTLSPNSNKTLYLLPAASGLNSYTISATSTNGHQITWTMGTAGKVTLSSSTSSSGASITVTAAAQGQTTLTANCDGGSASITVTVSNPTTVSTITIKKGGSSGTTVENESISPGDSLELTAVYTPASPTWPNFKWTSSNTSAATVSGSGATATVSVPNNATANQTSTITVYSDQDNDGVLDSGEARQTCIITVAAVVDRTVTFLAGTDTGNSSGQFASTISKSGISFYSSSIRNSDAPYRIYASSTTTFTSTVGNIVKIEFNMNGSYNSNLFSIKSGSTGSYNSSSSTKGVWTGSATSVSFEASAQARCDSIVITYLGAAPTLSSISLNTDNVQKSFTVNDSFNYTGLVVTAHYSDSTSSTVASGYTVSSPDMSTTGQKTVTVTYEGKTANYTINVSNTPSYTVTFNANGHGTAPASQTIVSGGKVTKPTDPTASGYTFGGWYKEAGCTNAWNFNTDTVTGNTELFAKWTAQAETDTNKTFEFSSNAWGSSNGNWTGSKNGNQLTSGQGVQITTSLTGVVVYSPSGFYKITKVEIRYCTNSSKGAGSISVYYSSSKTATTGTQIGSTFNVTKPSSGGTTLKTATFTPSSAISGTNYVQFKVTCTANSIYIYSIKVYYKTSS